MGNGTKRFNQIEAFISGLPEYQQDYAVEYYHSILNCGRIKSVPGDSGPVARKITDKIDTIMYKI